MISCSAYDASSSVSSFLFLFFFSAIRVPAISPAPAVAREKKERCLDVTRALLSSGGRRCPFRFVRSYASRTISRVRVQMKAEVLPFSGRESGRGVSRHGGCGGSSQHSCSEISRRQVSTSMNDRAPSCSRDSLTRRTAVRRCFGAKFLVTV